MLAGQDPACLYLPNAGIANMLLFLALYVGAGDPNLGPYACVAGTLMTEPSPIPSLFSKPSVATKSQTHEPSEDTSGSNNNALFVLQSVIELNLRRKLGQLYGLYHLFPFSNFTILYHLMY